MTRATLWAGRQPAPGLRLLADQVWPEGSAVELTLGRAPEGYRVVEQYAVVPSVESARMLMPTQRRVAISSLLAYRRLRRGPVRARKLLSAGVLGAGLGRLMSRDVLSVCVRQGADAPDRRLLAHLSDLLGVEVRAAIGVAAPAPNRKPTLQLFDPAGTPTAFVKVGWNDFTRHLVEHEATVLTGLGARAEAPHRPGVLHTGEWNGLRLLATSPMPATVVRHRPTDGPLPTVVRTIASWSAHGRSSSPLARSPYLDRLRSGLARCGDLLPDRLGERYLDRVLADHGDLPVDLAAWHGDWSPWNLGTADGRLWVWDWEHYGDCAPVGADLVHYAFQRRFVQAGAGVSEALEAARQVLPGQLPQVGVAPGNAAVLVDLYCLEMLLRAGRMKRLGAGENPRFLGGALTHARGRAG